jgi:tRNA pseudouridine55 synthase
VRQRTGDGINGWLVLDKPIGMTSATAVGIARRLLGARKAGHAGTLDPLATGILPIAFGEATKTVSYVVAADKHYSFTVRWGISRTTDDAEGEVVEESAIRPSEEDIAAALPGFTGKFDQIPPAYSAIKIAGRRAYDLARAAEAPDLAARPVVIKRFALLDMPDRDHARFEIECGKGTYVRSLARDLARALHTVAHITQLRRHRVGTFREEAAISLEEIRKVGHSAVHKQYLIPVETALDDIPALALTEEEAERLRHGRAVEVLRMSDRALLGQVGDGAIVWAQSAGRAVALTRVDGHQIRPVRILNL